MVILIAELGAIATRSRRLFRFFRDNASKVTLPQPPEALHARALRSFCFLGALADD